MKPWPFNDGLNLFHHDSDYERRIPDVLHHGKICELRAGYCSLGVTFLRLTGEEGSSKRIHKIWCRLLGDEDKFLAEDHDVAIVIFPYSFGLGEIPSLAGLFDELVKQSTVVKSGNVKKLLEDESEKNCELCQTKMTPGKDVGTLLNTTSGKLVCNTIHSNTGIFHVFHVSCLINWILLWECKTYENESLQPAFCIKCSLAGDRKNEMHLLRDEMRAGCKAWVRSPEVSEKGTIGLCFPEQEQQNSDVSLNRELIFYRAEQRRT